MTNREFFEKVIATVSDEELVAKATEEIEKLDARNAKRKNTPSKKSVENEPIKNAIKAVLSDTPLTASEIAEKVEISTQKASALLKQIDGLAVTDVKVKGKGTRKAYALAQSRKKEQANVCSFFTTFFRT